MRRILVSIVVAALCLVNAIGHAAQVSQSMNVSLIIGELGGQVTLIVGPLVLTGSQDGEHVLATGTSTINITASANLPYTIALMRGLHWTPGVGRALANSMGAFLLDYYLYKDAGYTLLWGTDVDPELGTTTSGVGTGNNQVYTVYGRTLEYSPALFPSDRYTDVVSVVVDF